MPAVQAVSVAAASVIPAQPQAVKESVAAGKATSTDALTRASSERAATVPLEQGKRSLSAEKRVDGSFERGATKKKSKPAPQEEEREQPKNPSGKLDVVA